MKHFLALLLAITPAAVLAQTSTQSVVGSSPKDWLSTLQRRWGHPAGYPQFAAQVTLTSNDPAAGYSILGGAQTLHLNPSGAAIGVQGHGIANQGSGTSSAWGLYGEAHRAVSEAGSAYGLEVDAVAHVPSIAPNPSQQGNTIGAQMACGGDYSGFSQFDCSSAIQIAANGARFITGLNVMRGSIIPGNAAIQLPTGNGLTFYNGHGHPGASIAASFTGNSADLTFDDNGLEVTDTGGATIASFPLSGVVTVGKALQLRPTAVATLPDCSAANEGELVAIVDATNSAFNAEIFGGGKTHVLGYCNGSRWTVH